MTETVAAGTERVAPAVAALGRVVERLGGTVSESRYRQLRMVVGMWGRALRQWPDGAPVPGPAASDLFDDESLGVFWDLAVAGRLRMLEQDFGVPLTVASRRVVRDCLGILAGAVLPGRAVWLPEVPQQEPKPTASRRQFTVLYRELVSLASGAPLQRDGSGLSYEDRVRLLALVSVVLDTGCRSVELEDMRLADLGEGEPTVRVWRQPQNGTAGPVSEVCDLQDGTRVALRRWLRVRAGLVARLEGTQSALWVSLRANQWQPEPGYALRAQGIRHAYTRGMTALNGLMAGRHGWEPMPVRMEQLRRAVAEPDDQEAGPG